MIDKRIILAYALKNAIEHDGNAAQGPVINGLFNHCLEKKDIPKVIPKIQEVLNEVNSFSIEEQKILFEKYKEIIGHRPEREGLPELPNVPKNGVVMRYRPAPSGPLHIGHIISNLISSMYVKKYGGKFYVIIDDTDPKTCLKESYSSIKKECDWIFGNVFEYINASDRVKIYYKYAEELIKKEKAYVCTCDKEKFKKLLLMKKPCSCRELDKKEQIKRWKKMLDKNGYKEGEVVLRFKSELEDPNPAMRDFPLARIELHEHPLQKNKYKVWPLMNLSVAADDIEFKMTHIIRGKDHMDNAKRQKLIFSSFGKEKDFPWVFFIGRIKFSDLELSKRKIKAKIEAGEYEDFEDIRLPTIASLRKRGYKKEAFEKFIEQRGLTEVDKVITQKDFFKVLDDFNKK